MTQRAVKSTIVSNASIAQAAVSNIWWKTDRHADVKAASMAASKAVADLERIALQHPPDPHE